MTLQRASEGRCLGDFSQDLLALLCPEARGMNLIMLGDLYTGLAAENTGKVGPMSAMLRQRIMHERSDDMWAVPCCGFKVVRDCP